MNTLYQKNFRPEWNFHFTEQRNSTDDPKDKPKTNDEDVITNDEEEDIITNDQENFNHSQEIDDDDPLKNLKVL